MTGRPSLLAVVARFRYGHIDYLRALADHFDLAVAWWGEGNPGAVEDALMRGLPLQPLGGVREDGEDAGLDGARRRDLEALKAGEMPVAARGQGS